MAIAALNFTLTLTSTLLIGIGNTTPEGTIRVARDVRGRPCIPAMTLKGAHRASAEQIARALGLAVCGAPIPDHMCYPLPGESACLVCRIFGSPWLPGKVFYRDLVINAQPVIDSRVMAAQSRRRRVRLESRTVQRELLPAPQTLTGRVDHLLADPVLLGLALAALRSITALGQGSATGCGLCSVIVKAIDSTQHPLSPNDEAALAAALRQFAQSPPSSVLPQTMQP